jgi:plastocyanin
MSGRSRREGARRRARRRWTLVAGGVGAVLVLVLASILMWGGEPTSSKGATRVVMTEFSFSPDPVFSPDGRLEIVNEGKVAHNFVVPELGKGTPELDPGESRTFDLSDQSAGTYLVICDLSSHRAAGMELRLTLQ